MEALYNNEAEMSVLGSLLIDPTYTKQVLPVLHPTDFYEEKHQILYYHITDLFRKDSPVDLVTLSTTLKEADKLKFVGGRSYLTELLAFVPTPHHALTYAKSVVKLSKKRELMTVAKEFHSKAQDLDADIDVTLNDFKSKLITLSDGRLEVERDIVAEYQSYKKEFSDLDDRSIMGMSTGLDSLDAATQGFLPNHVWVCGAYYGYGKTYFAINMINTLLEQGKRVLFFSLEMTAEEIIQRLVALRARLSLVETVGKADLIKQTRRQSAEDFIFEQIKNRRLLIDDQARDAFGVTAKMLSEENREHVDFVALDYIQLLAGKDQYESLREATVMLQSTTKTMKTTLLLLSQVNNESQKDGKFSKVDGFKGAGDIGQIANVAIKVLRERDSETGEFSPLFGLRLTKVRHGKPCSLIHEINFPGGKIRESAIKPQPEQPKTKKEQQLADIFLDL